MPAKTISIRAAELTRTSIEEWNNKLDKLVILSASLAISMHSVSVSGNMTNKANDSCANSGDDAVFTFIFVKKTWLNTARTL